MSNETTSEIEEALARALVVGRPDEFQGKIKSFGMSYTDLKGGCMEKLIKKHRQENRALRREERDL